jgi:hypothetical protein
MLFILFTSIYQAEAIDIQYGSILGSKNNDVLIQYYGIEKKNNYICNLLNLKCFSTKKLTLNNIEIPGIKNIEIRKELQKKGATHLTFSKSGTWLAYLLPAYEPDNIRTFAIRNLNNNTDYIINSEIAYWDIINEQRSVFEFSPDEKILIYTDDKDDAMSLYQVDMSTLKETTFEKFKLPTTAWNIGAFMFFD